LNIDFDREPSQAERAWLATIPKVEIHLHLEGAIPLDALWECVRKYGGDREVSSIEALEDRFQYRDFPHFIETWHWKQGFLREYDDFTLIAEAVARDLASQRIRYVEAFVSPSDVWRHGLETQRVIEAVRVGLDAAPDIQIHLVPDVVRNYGIESSLRVLEESAECTDYGVIGVGIGGSEHDYPPEPFADVFARARDHGLRTSAHAGEAAGPESVWGAIRTLEVDRIGHGTRAVEDPELVDHIVEHAIPIELNPISNLRTGVIGALSEHPVRTYFDLGIPLSVNTDDPKMFGNSLVDEFESLMVDHGFTREEIRELTNRTVDCTWLDDAAKTSLAAEINADPAWEAHS